ncbi:MAG: class I SAM-dependent methyltransferase, partial [Candidatus Udaeobacter sp.]
MAVLSKVKQFGRDFAARAIAPILRRLAPDPKYFELWQSHGFHVLPSDYYQPIPDTRVLPVSLWDRVSDLPGMDMREEAQKQLLSDIAARFKEEYAVIPEGASTPEFHFYLRNTAFEAVDAEMLFGLIRLLKPRRMYEIGSGFSTLLAADALRRNGMDGCPCRLIAIDPYPSAQMEAALPTDIELWRVPAQEISLTEFQSLGENDILFIDSSHVCKIGSDVEFLFLEVLPRLRPGVVVHVHDIFMPVEYPKQWVLDAHRFWNEQYLLQAFLSFNTTFEVLWAGQWMHIRYPDLLMKAFPSYKA